MIVGVFLVSPTIPLLAVASLITVLFSLCPCHPLNRTTNGLSIVKAASNFVCEVQHVSGVELCPSDIVLSVSNKEMWNHDLLRL